MAESYTLVRNVHFPRRTVSFPTRLPSSNPLEIVSELKSLRASASAPAAPPCPRTIESYLGKLAEMYEVVGDIAMSLTGRNGKATVERVVDDVILLLDVCGYARDMVSSTKLEVQDLQSVLRRKSRSVVVVEVERQVKSFVRFRKNTRRAMSKHLNRLKRLERKNSVVATRFTNMEDGHSATVRESLRDLCGIAVTILRSLLVFFRPSLKGRGGRGWSFLSRLVLSTGRGKRRSSAELNAAEVVDSTVYSLMKNRTGREAVGIEDVRRVQKVLEEMISNYILGLEEGLDCLHMSLIRHRVCLLNLLTN